MGNKDSRLIRCAGDSKRGSLPIFELPEEVPTTSTFHDTWHCQLSETKYICYCCGKPKGSLKKLVEHIVKNRMSDEMLQEVLKWIASRTQDEQVYCLLRVMLYIDFPLMKNEFISVVTSRAEGKRIALAVLPHYFDRDRIERALIYVPARYCAKNVARIDDARQIREQERHLVCPHCAQKFSCVEELAFHLLFAYFTRNNAIDMIFRGQNPFGMLIARPSSLISAVHERLQEFFDETILAETHFIALEQLPMRDGRCETFDWIPTECRKKLSKMCVVLRPDDPNLEYYVMQRYQRSDDPTRCPCCGRQFSNRSNMTKHLVKSLYRLGGEKSCPSFTISNAMKFLRTFPRQFTLSLTSTAWTTAIFVLD